MTPSMNQTTDAVAVGAIASPLWLPQIEYFSTVASAVLPVLGAVWLLVQIYSKFQENKREQERFEKEMHKHDDLEETKSH